MKIYNEIVIDMNPESSSYGETLHEDSFEYEGNMMLMQGTPGFTAPEVGDIIWLKRPDDTTAGEAGKYQSMEFTGGNSWRAHHDYRDAPPSGSISFETNDEWKEWQRDVLREFTYDPTKGFDPTSEEFQESVTETGGFEEIIEGYKRDPEDFDDFYGKPLEFWEQEYSTEIDPETGLAKGTLAQGRGLDLATITERERAGGVGYDIAGEAAQERLRSAQAGYGFGMEAAGLQVGKSLFNVKQQTEQQLVGGGFARQGSVASISGRAQKGIMADYNLQQRQLADSFTGAKSAFDITQKEITEGRAGLAKTAKIDRARTALAGNQASIDYERNIADFWKKTEDEFYERADYLETIA